MLTIVRVTVSPQEDGAVKRPRCNVVSECWDLWRLRVKTQSTRTSVIKEPSTSFWVKTERHASRNILLDKCVLYALPGCVFPGILTQMEVSFDEDDAVTVEIKSDIQLILSVLCESDMHRKVKPRWSTLKPQYDVNCTLMWKGFCILNMPCCTQELFGSEGVEMAIHFLKKGSNKFYRGLGHNKLVLTTVDCVWSVWI